MECEGKDKCEDILRLEMDINFLKRKIESKDLAFKKFLKQNEETIGQRDAFEVRNILLEDENDKLFSRINFLKKEIERLENEIEKLNQEKIQLKRKADNLEADNKRLDRNYKLTDF